MRLILFSLFISCLHGNLFAEFVQTHYYVVVSDKPDPSVKAGTCELSGRVVDSNKKPVFNGTIANFDRTRSTTSDKEGNYRLTLSARDTALFFYHEEYGEVVIWKYLFQSQHRVQIDFYVTKASEIPVVVEKPVIYLYGESGTALDLKLTAPNLGFTYPEYDQGWQVKLSEENGIVNTKTGKSHPYLFWEGQSTGLNYAFSQSKAEGFLVHTDSLVNFLESSLGQMGLNSVESCDFITYWAPRMVLNQYVFIQFITDENYAEKISGLEVNPQPESMRRVYMLWSGIEYPVLPFQVVKQELPSFERRGLTLVEWGGSELPFIYPVQL